MAHGPQWAKTRGDFFHKGADRIALQVLGLEPVGDAAEVPQPSPGLRQRDADMPAAAFARLARFCHHRAERHQIAGGMIEHLRGQFLWPIDTCRLSLSMIESVRGL